MTALLEPLTNTPEKTAIAMATVLVKQFPRQLEQLPPSIFASSSDEELYLTYMVGMIQPILANQEMKGAEGFGNQLLMARVILECRENGIRMVRAARLRT